MMKRKILAMLLIFSFVLLLVPFSGAMAAVGSEKIPSDSGYGFTYRFVTKDTIEITSYGGYEETVTVPSVLDGYTVVGIAGFHRDPEVTTANDKVQKVILPETVTYIGENAFYQSTDWYEESRSALEEIVLPQSLKTIGEGAFYNCTELKTIEIPSGVTEIGSDAFTGCSSLQTIKLHCGVTALKDGAFGSVNSGLPLALSDLYDEWLYDETASDFLVWEGQLLAYKGSGKTPVIPDGVVTVGRGVFQYSDITAVTIPDGVKIIGGSAFQGCTALKSVTIPQSVERIGDSAFAACANLSAVTFSKGLKIIGDNAFDDCEALTSVSLPEGLLEMGINVFDSCYGLSKITFPSSLEKMDLSSIQYTAWYESLADDTELYCGGVFLGIVDTDYSGYPSKLTIRPGTKTVYLENYLTGVHELILPDGLKSITIKDAGSNYCGITRLTVPESVEYININEIPTLTEINLPERATLEEGCFLGCVNIQNLTLPKGNTILRSIGIGRTENLVLPEDVMEIQGAITNGNHNGSGNACLKSVNLNNLRILGNSALAGCTRLETVTLPDTLAAIGDGAFEDCGSLKAIKGGKSVRVLGDACFKNCTALTDLGSLTSSVRRLEHESLANTGWYLNQPSGPVYFGTIAYCYKGTMPQNTVLALKDSTTAVTDGYILDQLPMTPHNMADFEQPNLTGIVLPESCARVDAFAFFNCENLKAADLGGVQIIGDEALESHGCESIALPDTARYVGDSAFASTKLQSVHLNNGLRVIEKSAFFSLGTGQGVTVPETVTYLGYHCLGYYPEDPDSDYTASLPIENFVIYGKSGTAAEAYADENGFAFRTDTCAAHSWTTVTVPASCQSTGYTLKTCVICGETEKSGSTAKTAHSAVTNDSQAATCTTPGYTGGSHCAACGQSLSKATATTALGHNWVVDTETNEWDGYYGMTRHYCRTCDLTWYEAAGGTEPHTHDYSYRTTVVPPTCTQQGYTVHACECGDSYRDSATAALGHQFVNGSCSRCGLPQAVCDGGAACPSRKFIDVNTNEWYHLYVDYAVTNGLFNGTGSNTFEPQTAMTRAMLVTVLWRYEGSPAAGSPSFDDVPKNEWYSEAVAWAETNGVVNGVGAGKFAPNGKITREQMATILFRYSQKKGMNTDKRGSFNAFPDAGQVSAYAAEAMSWTVGEGIINGSDGLLLPQGNATRAQVATILTRYIENIVKR
ncbi:MAG: leucine-rich repeat protein [Clostridia bacterium]